MIIQGSAEQLSEKAALLMYNAIKKILLAKKDVVIAVPGGRSVAAVFQAFGKYGLPWHHVHIFLLDERLVPLDHPDSNYRLIKKHMGEHLPEEILYPFIFDPAEPLRGVRDYTASLENVGGKFDLVLASSGEDGHIGSLFPHHPSVDAKDDGFILVNESPKPPRVRMSASVSLLRNSSMGLILFLGEGKRSALRNFFNIHLSHRECPAKLMTKMMKYYLLTDQEVETP